MIKTRKGKILKVKLGVNPNSSSLGTDILFLMIGTPLLAVLVFTLSTFLRTSRRKKQDAERKDPHIQV